MSRRQHGGSQEMYGREGSYSRAAIQVDDDEAHDEMVHNAKDYDDSQKQICAAYEALTHTTRRCKNASHKLIFFGEGMPIRHAMLEKWTTQKF